MTEDSGARVSSDVPNDASTNKAKCLGLSHWEILGLLGGITVPGTPVTGAHLMNPLEASSPTIPQPKIQDELIAREIVINDAESLIQRCTGAVVITRLIGFQWQY
ncbi:hypothetical protein GBA52_028883 [Prunus armeniaca]|nr:hypothetical protein GBA52_028883 [Prunus armeniaca]